MVYEAQTVVGLQEMNERFDLHLTARLSSASNDNRVDVFAFVGEERIDFQLKVGSRKYVRAAVATRAEGVVLLAPPDVLPEVGSEVMSEIVVDDIRLESPTSTELLEDTTRLLDRLGADLPVLTGEELARRALIDGLTDGAVAVLFDLSIQLLSAPEKPLDWKRSAKCLIRVGSRSALASFFASSQTFSAIKLGKHSIDAAPAFRAARVAGCVLPHLIEVGFDAASVFTDEITPDEFGQRLAGHAGAAILEYACYPIIARIAARCGPLGWIVLVVGGAILARTGDALGRLAYDITKELAPIIMTSIESGPVARELDAAKKTIIDETARREAKAGNRLCEEDRCAKAHHARGMCRKHYQRWWRKQRSEGRQIFRALASHLPAAAG